MERKPGWKVGCPWAVSACFLFRGWLWLLFGTTRGLFTALVGPAVGDATNFWTFRFFWELSAQICCGTNVERPQQTSQILWWGWCRTRHISTKQPMRQKTVQKENGCVMSPLRFSWGRWHLCVWKIRLLLSSWQLQNEKTLSHHFGGGQLFFFFFFFLVKQEQEIVRPWKLSFSVWTRNQFSDQSRNGKHKTETYPAVRCRPQQTPASWLYAKFWSNPEPVKQRNICSEANQNLENRTKCLFWKNPEPVKQKEM